MQKLVKFARLLPLFVLVVTAVGCGSGDTPDPNAQTPGASTAGTTGAAAGTAGTAGTTGAKGGVQPPGI
jgi:hypothetical protein